MFALCSKSVPFWGPAIQKGYLPADVNNEARLKRLKGLKLRGHCSFIQDFVGVGVGQGFIHLNLQAWLMSCRFCTSCFIISVSNMCVLCKWELPKKKQETGGMNICHLEIWQHFLANQLLSLPVRSSADVKLKLLKLRVFSPPDFRHLPPPSRSWTQPPGGFETNGDPKPSASRWVSGCVPCSACRGRYLEAP